MMSKAPALVAMMFLGCGLAIADLAEYLQPATLVCLAEAKDVGALTELYDALPYHDSAMDVVYWSRRYALEPNEESAEGLLTTVPRSPLEFWYLYSVTYTDAYKESTALATLIAGYYEVLARLVLQHGKGMRAFLTLSRFADGESAEQLADWNSFLLKNDRGRFLAALRELDDEGRRRVCGECSMLEQAPESGASRSHDCKSRRTTGSKAP